MKLKYLVLLLISSTTTAFIPLKMEINKKLSVKNIYNKYVYKNKKFPKILKVLFKNVSLKEAEIKHSRIAMLAVTGRFSAEIIHPKLAIMLYSDNLLANKELVPSLLNGNLCKIHPLFYIFTLSYVMLFELNHLIDISDLTAVNKKKVEKNYIFDPLNIYNGKNEIEKNKIKDIEINFGRIAMILSSFFTYYEYITKKSIINNEILHIYPWLIFGIYIIVFT